MVRHGQLTRAGKVRSLTPVIAPKERGRKSLAGRAKKRQIFAKRFEFGIPKKNAQEPRD